MIMPLLYQNFVGEFYSLFMLTLFFLHRQPVRQAKLATFVGLCFIGEYLVYYTAIFTRNSLPNPILLFICLTLISLVIFYFKLDEKYYLKCQHFFIPMTVGVQLVLALLIALTSARFEGGVAIWQPLALSVLFNLNLLYTFYGLFVLNQYSHLKVHYLHISREIGRNIESLIRHVGEGHIELPIQSNHPLINAVLFADSSRHQQYHHWVNTESIQMDPDQLGLFLYTHQQAIQNTYPNLAGKYSCEGLVPNQLQFLIPKAQISTHQVDVNAVLKSLLPFGLNQGLLKEAMREAKLKPGEHTLSQDHLIQSFIPV